MRLAPPLSSSFQVFSCSVAICFVCDCCSGLCETDARLVPIGELNAGSFKSTLKPIHCGLLCIGPVFDSGNGVRRDTGFLRKFPNAPSYCSASHSKL